MFNVFDRPPLSLYSEVSNKNKPAVNGDVYNFPAMGKESPSGVVTATLLGFLLFKGLCNG